MTKKIIAAVLCAIVCFGLVGCSSSGYLNPTQAAKYVTKLGQYKGLTCDLTTKDNKASVEETLTSTASSTEKITDRAVAKGDIVNIDYEGVRLDTNVVFAGGTAAGQDLEIGSGKFIAGFEDGLVGVKPGETVKLKLKFPKDYSANKSLADKDVEFTVTVNHIVGYSEEDIKRSEDSVAASILLQNILTNTTFTTKMPSSIIKSRANELTNQIKSAAATAGMSLTDYLSKYYSMTEAQLNDQAISYATTNVKQEIILMAIANDAGITVSEDEYTAEIAKQAKKFGYEGREEAFIEAYGGKDNVRNTIFLNKVTDYLIANSEIKR